MAELKAKVGLETSEFETGLARLQNAAGSFASGLGKMILGGFAFDKIISGVTSLVEKASQLQDISDKFGISAESIQRIGNVAEQNGASMESVVRALAKIGVSAQEAASGNENLKASFAAIGVSGEDLIRLNPEQLFYKLANAMNDGSIAGRDLAIVKDLIGKGFQQVLPVLRLTEEQIRAIGEASGILGDSEVEKLDQFGDAWTRLANKAKVGAASVLDGLIRIGEEIKRNPLSFFDQDKMEDNIQAQIKKENDLRNLVKENKLKMQGSVDSAELNAKNKEERDKKDVAEAKQELRMLEAGISGQAAAEKMARDFESKRSQTDRAEKEVVPKARKNTLEVLADSLQKVGGGGQFARVGGADSILKDQLATLKSIDKNISKMGGQPTDETGAQ